MANFSTHLTVAAAGSLTATAVVMQATQVTQPEALLLFLLGLFAGILPDIDSDHSIPAKLLFTILSFATGIAVVFLYSGKLTVALLLLLAGVAALSVRFLLCPLFAATTEHRGLFHSVPVALLFGLAVFYAGVYLLGWQTSFGWLAAAFVAGGYMVHLLLDELYSVDFTGANLKGSFGSAFTIFSRRAWLSYLMLYAAVGAGMIWLPFPRHLLAV